jgi:flagellar biosynthesis protein FlhB
MIKIKSRYVNICLVSLIVLIFFFCFEWANNLAIYKDELFKPGANDVLTEEQLSYLKTALFCKYALINLGILFVSLLIVYNREPSFKGRLEWVS